MAEKKFQYVSPDRPYGDPRQPYLYYASSIDPEDAARCDAAPSTTRTSRRRRRELMASGETTKTLVMRQTQEAVGKSASRVGARRTNEGWENSTVRVPENE